MTDESALGEHAAGVHDGFAREDGDFQAKRERRAELVRQFLQVMDEAGKPGLSRKFGSTVLQLTGQRPEHYWSTKLADSSGTEREVLIFDDGTHGWSDEIAYSDRPRTPTDEISPELLERALGQIAADHDLTWSPTA